MQISDHARRRLFDGEEEEKNAPIVCCICGAMINGRGNNPAPLVTDGSPDGVCCDQCNYMYVIPARREQMN